MTNVIPMQAVKSVRLKKSDIPDNAVRLIDRMFIRLKSIFLPGNRRLLVKLSITRPSKYGSRNYSRLA